MITAGRAKIYSYGEPLYVPVCGTAAPVSTWVKTHGACKASASPTRLPLHTTRCPSMSATSNAAAPFLMSAARLSRANPGRRTEEPHATNGPASADFSAPRRRAAQRARWRAGRRGTTRPRPCCSPRRTRGSGGSARRRGG